MADSAGLEIKAAATEQSAARGPGGLRGLEKFLLGLLIARMLVIVARCRLPLNPPEIWRQVVTLGVSLRYWLRWTVETGVRMPLFPALLDSRDTQGIMPTEFPILNILFAPLFAFGPAWGRALAILLFNALVLLLVVWNARIWRDKRILGIEPAAAMLLMPIFSISLYWSERFMPDFPSVLLVCMAVGLSWREDRFIRSFLLASVGLLMKPTAVIVFLLYLAHDRGWRKWKTAAAWIIPSACAALLYYTLGVTWIEKYQELPLVIAVKPRSVIPGIVAFFENWPTILKFYWERGFFLGGAVLVLGIGLWSRFARGTRFPGLLWGISLLQFFVIAVLDGVLLFYNHDYYLMGMSVVFCLLFVDAWEKSHSRWLKALLVLGICVPLIESCLIDLKTLYKRPRLSSWELDRQCRELIERHPEFPWHQGRPFRSPAEEYPTLGLYFGEREGSLTSDYGFFWSDAPIPTGCRRVDRTEDLSLVRCS